MQNRTTFMERINERVSSVENVLKKMEPVEELLERLAMLENNIYTTKKVLTFCEACLYMGVSESLLYKLTSAREVPHYKPRGKMLYFNKEELDQWLLQNNVPTIGAVTKVETDEKEEVKPYFGQKRYGRKKSNL
ncbi:MAG: helix-turn-helix domain-containing protein [Prevotellaceae bacterium]|nr:helix-turn-helix domain-containing protein [Prevotellaceae bacterium]